MGLLSPGIIILAAACCIQPSDPAQLGHSGSEHKPGHATGRGTFGTGSLRLRVPTTTVLPCPGGPGWRPSAQRVRVATTMRRRGGRCGAHMPVPCRRALHWHCRRFKPWVANFEDNDKAPPPATGSLSSAPACRPLSPTATFGFSPPGPPGPGPAGAAGRGDSERHRDLRPAAGTLGRPSGPAV